MGISFTEDEMKWVDELMSLETFPEIVEFTDRLYDYCAENESMTDDHDFDMFSSDGYGEDDEEIELDMTGETPFEWTEDTDESMSQSGMLKVLMRMKVLRVKILMVILPSLMIHQMVQKKLILQLVILLLITLKVTKKMSLIVKSIRQTL